jgi:hypothetical protein
MKGRKKTIHPFQWKKKFKVKTNFHSHCKEEELQGPEKKKNKNKQSTKIGKDLMQRELMITKY